MGLMSNLTGFGFLVGIFSLLISTSFSAASNKPESQVVSDLPTQAMLVEIETWLSKTFDLPLPTTHPRIELASPARIAALRYRAFKLQSSDANAGDGSDTLAVYDNATQTIYLPEGWTGMKPAEMSVLVHEMVHHMQRQAKLKYECPPASEKVAYEAQIRWLVGFGLTLESEFGIDAFTLLVRTACGP
jgi:hypothetical protein